MLMGKYDRELGASCRLPDILQVLHSAKRKSGWSVSRRGIADAIMRTVVRGACEPGYDAAIWFAGKQAASWPHI